MVGMDVRDRDSIASCLRGREIDTIVHLAAMNAEDSFKSPEEALDINVAGTYRLLECAKENGVERVVYFSTIHVYGPELAGKITEDTPAKPVHPYGTTHRAAEDIVNYYRRYHGMKTLIFRASNGYGYPMDASVNAWSLLFNDICRQLMTSGRIVLRSSGRQKRDFISLAAVSEAVRYFLFSAPDDWGDGLYNLGGGASLSVLDAVRFIGDVYAEKYGKKPEPPQLAAGGAETSAAAEVDYRIDKLLRSGFAPRSDMRHEIERTLALCEQFRANGGANAV